MSFIMNAVDALNWLHEHDGTIDLGNADNLNLGGALDVPEGHKSMRISIPYGGDHIATFPTWPSEWGTEMVFIDSVRALQKMLKDREERTASV